jgi:hypothetical protein
MSFMVLSRVLPDNAWARPEDASMVRNPTPRTSGVEA